MRRSGSSSCLLRAKDSLSDDERSNGSRGEQLSVTVISTEKLPNYSTERYFMLSEIDAHGHSTKFLSDYSSTSNNVVGVVGGGDGGNGATSRPTDNGSSSTKTDTNDTNHNAKTCDVLDANHGDENNNANATEEEEGSFAPFTIVYILWRPDMTTSVGTFTETVIVEAIRKIRGLVPIQPNTQEKIKTIRSSASLSSLASLEEDNKAAEGTNGAASRHRLYLVIDRVAPPSHHHHNIAGQLLQQADNDAPPESSSDAATTISLNDASSAAGEQRHFRVERKLAEKLARHVASHHLLRVVCEGITVGVANHERAAPGLEACLTAIAQGSKIRRQTDRSKSRVGLLAGSPQDLLGIEEERETDAAQGVLQVRIFAEWNSKGNIYSFANRAHDLWRKERGLPTEEESKPMRKPRSSRRLRRSSRAPAESRHNGFWDFGDGIDEILINLVGLGLFVVYLYFLFGFGEDNNDDDGRITTTTTKSSEEF